MKRLMISILLISVVLGTSPAVLADATNWNINGVPTQDWFSSQNNYRNIPLMWMRDVDPLIAAGSGNPGTGSFYYVDSNVSNAGDGSSWSNAVATIAEAVALCTANKGDRIKVAQAHAENIASAAALNLNVAGITIEGCGNGDDMPELSLTAQASTVQISAADVTIIGIRFLGNYTNGVTECLDITANGDGYRIISCEFRETSNTKELLKMITVTADADRGMIYGNRFLGEAGGTDSIAINFEGGSDKSVVAQNTFIGDWSGYVIDATTAASTELAVYGNYIHNADTTAGKTMAFHASTTGGLFHNECYGNGPTYAVVGDAMYVSPTNIFLNVENVETTVTYYDLITAIKTVTDDLAGISQIGDKVQADMDANSLLVNITAARAGYLDNINNALLLELGLSEIGDKVVADMDANSAIVSLTTNNLDHMAKTAVANGDDLTAEVVDGTIWSNFLTKTGNTSDYARATMSVEAFTDILNDLGGISEVGDKVVADMDANSILADLQGISEIGDKIVADMDANSTTIAAIKAVTDDLAGISQVGDKVQADMDANSVLFWQPRAIQASTDEITGDLFTVTGGPIEILSFYGYVDALIGAGAATCKIWVDTTAGASYDQDFSTAVNIETDAVGTMYVFSAANPAVLTPLTPGSEGAGNPMYPWICPPGTIEQLMSGDPGGAGGDHITWTMVYRPLKAGVTVADAS